MNELLWKAIERLEKELADATCELVALRENNEHLTERVKEFETDMAHILENGRY